MNKEESILQSKCFQWFWNEFPHERRMLFCVNNNSTHYVTGNNNKALGVVKGVSDMIFICAGEVIFIEFKVGRNTQSDEQKDFEEKVKKRGHLYVIIRDIETFKSFILDKLLGI